MRETGGNQRDRDRCTEHTEKKGIVVFTYGSPLSKIFSWDMERGFRTLYRAYALSVVTINRFFKTTPLFRLRHVVGLLAMTVVSSTVNRTAKRSYLQDILSLDDSELAKETRSILEEIEGKDGPWITKYGPKVRPFVSSCFLFVASSIFAPMVHFRVSKVADSTPSEVIFHILFGFRLSLSTALLTKSSFA